MAKKRTPKQNSCKNCEQSKKLAEVKKQLTEAEKQIRNLNKEIEKKRQRIEELEGELRASKRQAGHFSRRNPKEEPKKAGRKLGHPGCFRSIPDHIDQVMKVSLDCCPQCGGVLEDIKEDVQYVEDIPPIRPKVIEYQTQSGWCPRCRKHFHSRHPQQISTAKGCAGTQIGPVAVTLASELKHRLGIPYRKVSSIFQGVLGLNVTGGGLCQAIERLAYKSKPTYDLIVQRAQESAVIHGDETGWSVNGKSAWMWVFTNTQLTIYVVRFSRGHDVIEEILGLKYDGVLVSDFFCAYDPIDCVKAKCMSHLLEDLSKIEKQKKGISSRFSRKASLIIREAMELKRQKKDLPETEYKKKAEQTENQMDQLLLGKYSDPDNHRLAERMHKHRQSLFTFLYNDQVDPTNNQAERQIRPAVIIRKISAGNRTTNGAFTHEVIASLIETCRQQNKQFATVAQEIMAHFDRLEAVPIFQTTESKLLPEKARDPCRELELPLLHNNNLSFDVSSAFYGGGGETLCL